MKRGPRASMQECVCSDGESAAQRICIHKIKVVKEIYSAVAIEIGAWIKR